MILYLNNYYYKNKIMLIHKYTNNYTYMTKYKNNYTITIDDDL